MIEINWKPSSKDLRIFAGLLMLFLGLVAWWLWRRWEMLPLAIGVASAGVMLGLAGLALPRLMRPIYIGWMVAAFPLGWLISHVVLAIVFYGVMTPLGLGLRLFGHDPLQRRTDPAAKTYWKERKQRADIESYFRPF